MSTEILLSVGRLEMDWGKNFNYSDHSQLFQLCDLREVPYYYRTGNHTYREGEEDFEYETTTKLREGLAKPIEHVVERLNLLGYTMKHARQEFEYVCRMTRVDSEKLSFEQFAEALGTVDVASVSADYGDEGRYGRFFRYVLFYKLGLDNLVDDAEYVRNVTGEALENLSASTILRLVAANPAARGLPVIWHFADFEEDEGWPRREDIVRPVHQEDRFLVVTEGSSDAEVLRRALDLLKPHLADFFYFVDMSEGYPFTGTGNLHRFTKGLGSIEIQNNIVILYDNDAEGVLGFKKTVDLNLPENIRVLKLPDLGEFEQFRTLGPAGPAYADINGRAAAIECYLDVGPEAVVRWTNYKKELDCYHGELLGKRAAMLSFLRQAGVGGNYDFSKIAAVLETVLSECAAMRESARLAKFEVR